MKKIRRKILPILHTAVTVVAIIALVLNLNGYTPTSAAVTSVAGSDNLLLNSQFKAQDYSTSPIASTTGSGSYFSNRWRIKHTNGSSSATMQRINQYSGGTRLTFSNTSSEYFYVRQTIPGVMQFSDKNFTIRADIGSTDPGLKYDFYINARWNQSDWVNIADTSQQSIVAGALTATMSVGDLSAYGYTEDSIGGLEIAFRVYLATPKTNAEVDIDSISFYEGSNLSEAPISDYNEERAILNTYYETADYSTSVVGLSAEAGQKRATFSMTSKKRKGTDYQLRYFDALGHEGKVSVYRQDGARFDNITPDSVRKSDESFIFVFYNSEMVGIGLSWIADAEM